MSYISWIIGIVIAVYLYIDAKKHGKSQWLWAILGFLFSFLTLSIYFFKTRRKGLGVLFVIIFIIAVIFEAVVIAGTVANAIQQQGIQ